MSFVAAVLIFGIIIMIHEFGHFLFAKLNGIGVIEFSLGMGPRLYSFEKGGTRYSIKILPFGGSCMMLGEDEENSDQSAFNNKSVWARISVVAAGPIFNFLLAFLLSMVIVGLTGNHNATPDKIAKYAQDNGYYLKGTGTSWSLLTEGASHFGVVGREISLSKETVCGVLKQGQPVICSVGRGDFTTEGHFIVLTGMKDGRIKVNDPNCIHRSCLWKYETLEPQIKNLWAYQG